MMHRIPPARRQWTRQAFSRLSLDLPAPVYRTVALQIMHTFCLTAEWRLRTTSLLRPAQLVCSYHRMLCLTAAK